jgi:hypothetical protein
MANLAPHKTFPSSTGVEVPACVIVSTPIPRRKVPLKGLKALLCPPAPIEDVLPLPIGKNVVLGEEYAHGSGGFRLARKGLFWLIVLPLGVLLYFILASLLFMLLTAFR